ncbi:MAG: ABC transporter substrate-binding protein, partial [Eubacteriales bacterium]
MKKILILFSLLLLTACESIHLEPELSTDLPQTFYTPKTQIPFTLAIYPEESLHPTQVTNKTNLALCGLLYEGLFYLDESFTPHPLLVDTYSKSEDGYSWTFTLKEGITFWDSTPLTADLVVTALREAMTTSSRYFNRLQGISSINSVENTVVINLTTPNQNLPALLDVPISYGGGTLPQGTGPYLYQDGMLQLTVHKNWHGETTPHTVALLPIEKTSDLIPSFDTTQITLIDFSLTNNSSMGYSDHYEVWQYPTSTMVFLGINHKTVNDATLRSALSTAIDRTTLCSLVYAGYAVPSSLPVHPNHLNYDQSLELPYDPI